MRNSETYQSRASRDARARELWAEGARVRLSSMRNQLMHPMYLKDSEGSYERGFGNTDYRTHFAAIYTVSWEWPTPGGQDR